MNKYFSSIIIHVGGVCAVQHSEEDNNRQYNFHPSTSLHSSSRGEAAFGCWRGSKTMTHFTDRQERANRYHMSARTSSLKHSPGQFLHDVKQWGKKNKISPSQFTLQQIDFIPTTFIMSCFISIIVRQSVSQLFFLYTGVSPFSLLHIFKTKTQKLHHDFYPCYKKTQKAYIQNGVPDLT